MATAETAFGGGLNSSSGGELKLYLKWKRNTIGSGCYSSSVVPHLHNIYFKFQIKIRSQRLEQYVLLGCSQKIQNSKRRQKIRSPRSWTFGYNEECPLH